MPWPALPVGLCTVASGLAAAGHEVEVLDLMFVSDPARETQNRVRKCDPDIVGLSIRNIDNCNFEVPYFYLTDIRDQVVRSVRAGSTRAKIVVDEQALISALKSGTILAISCVRSKPAHRCRASKVCSSPARVAPRLCRSWTRAAWRAASPPRVAR